MSLFITSVGKIQHVVVALLILLVPAIAFCIEAVGEAPNFQVADHSSTRIFDSKNLLTPTDSSTLEDQLNDVWKRTGLKSVIVIDSSINTWESLSSFAERMDKAKHLYGREKHQSDIFFVVDPLAKQAVFRVSSELMQDLPRGSVDRIVFNYVDPALQRGELMEGISEGIKRITTLMEQHNRINRSFFVHGYGALAAIGTFIFGMLLRRKWGPNRSALAAASAFGAVVCFDGFNTGFSWYEVLSFVILTAPFLGLFVWIGMGEALSADTGAEKR